MQTGGGTARVHQSVSRLVPVPGLRQGIGIEDITGRATKTLYSLSRETVVRRNVNSESRETASVFASF